ncbi:MAG TPA: hypothetical protein VGF17_07045 [Phytomonospora sp.]
MTHQHKTHALPDPRTLPPRSAPRPAHRLLALQASAGNAAVTAHLQRVGDAALRHVRVPDFDGIPVLVKCTRAAPDQRWRVYLPPDGVPRIQLDAIADRLGVATGELDVTNAPGHVQGNGSRDRAAVIRDAKELAVRYLESAGVTGIDDHTAAQVLDTVRVRFFADREWAEVLASQTIGGGDPAMTEAITTTQQDRGSRAVYANSGNSTLPALVHEMFHALSANGLDGLWHGLTGELVEGITEYWTTRATGIGFRCTRADGGRVYSDALGFVRLALSSGLVTEDRLRDGYFHGDLGPLAALNADFLAARAASERSSS